MMTEHSFAWDIVSDLNAVWREDEQCRTWDVLGKNNPYESHIKALVKEKLQQYQGKLDSYTPTDLELKATIRSSDLGDLYQHSSKQCDRLNTEALYDFERNMILTLRDLTIGYAAAAVIAYYKKGIGFHLPESFSAEEDALAASASAQDLTDTDTFLSILHASTCEDQNQHQLPQKPKDVILNNPTAVALLQRMQDAKLLDADYHWFEYSNGRRNYKTLRAYFAHDIADKAKIEDWDVSFSDLWGITGKSLSTSYSDSGYTGEATQKKYQDLVDIILSGNQHKT